ncbi:MAG: ATPase, T2SS/T4P/T4SS family [Bdellovibrionales bacterium]|nr:ATPase, T2SS/T4P/T4SS family [Bdellovibrionales bacterium]
MIQTIEKEQVQEKEQIQETEQIPENKDLQKNLLSVFSHVFKNFQELTQVDTSQSNILQHPEEKSRIDSMKDKLKNLSPPQYYPRLASEIFGMGPITDLIQNKNISEIIINGGRDIFYEKKGKLHILEDHFLSDLTFRNFTHRVLDEIKQTLSLKQPFTDGNWRGWRIHIAMRPVVNVDFHLSFRRHPEDPWTLPKLKDQGWAPEKALHLIEKLLSQRSNILIVGPTSSGKTSVLNACLKCLPHNERVIIIEDSSELLLPNSVSTKLLTRSNSNSPDTLLDIDQSELVRQSLRMRPDRVVMGEARGPEAKDLLMALATGHSGSLGTLHAKDHKQALWRLEMLVQMGAPSWDTDTIRQMIVLSITHLMVLGRYMGERKLMGIYKLSGVEQTGFLFEALYAHLSNPDSCFVN